MTTLSLVDKKAESNQDIIDHLENTLVLAREGKIVNLIIGYTDNEHRFWTISSYTDFISAVGLAEMLKQDVINSVED